MNNLIKDAKNAAKEAREKVLTFKSAEAIDCIQKHFKDHFEYFEFVEFNENFNSFEIRIKDLLNFQLFYLFDTKGLYYSSIDKHMKIKNLADLGFAIEKYEDRQKN